MFFVFLFIAIFMTLYYLLLAVFVVSISFCVIAGIVAIIIFLIIRSIYKYFKSSASLHDDENDLKIVGPGGCIYKPHHIYTIRLKAYERGEEGCPVSTKDIPWISNVTWKLPVDDKYFTSLLNKLAYLKTDDDSDVYYEGPQPKATTGTLVGEGIFKYHCGSEESFRVAIVKIYDMGEVTKEDSENPKLYSYPVNEQNKSFELDCDKTVCDGCND